MIGIYGGTFDPVHFGHLRTALDVMQGIDLHQVRFIPLHRAVHREQPGVTGDLRRQMLAAAIHDQPGFLLDERELQRRGESYTVDTLTSLRMELGDRPICLLVGGDAFSQFLTWRQPLEILDLTHVVVMQRPGHGELVDPALKKLLSDRGTSEVDRLKMQPAGHIYFQPVTQLEISSTHIRQLLASGQSPRYLLPDPVIELISAHQLYTG